MRFLTGICILLPLWWSTTTARADLIVQFGQGGHIGLPSLNVLAGTALTLDIYLTQRGVDPNNGVLADYRLSSGAAARGLGSFFIDIAVTNSAHGLAQTDVRPADPLAFTYGPGFFDLTGENGFLDAPGGSPLSLPGSSSAARFVGFGAIDSLTTVLPVFAAAPHQVAIGANAGDLTANSILLGSLTFSVSGTALGDYELALSAPGSIQRSTLGNDPLNGYVDLTFSRLSLSVTSVPEPTTGSLVTVFGALGVWRRSRKGLR